MKKLIRSGKLLTVRPMKKSDYKAWITSYRIRPVKKQNRWDSRIIDDEAKFTKEAFYEYQEKRVQLAKEDKFYLFGVFNHQGEFIGIISFMDVMRSSFQSAILGYAFFPQHWGKGYGTEATRLVLDIAFHDLKFHRIEAGISPFNKRSIALIKKVGFRREGLAKR